MDLPALYDLLSLSLTRSSRESLETGLERTLGAVLGKDVIKEVLPALGPDWGLCVTAPPAESKHWAPQFLLGVRVSGGAVHLPSSASGFGQ